MPKFFRWVGVVLLVVVCGLGGLTLWARSGPTLAQPAVDPVVRLNAAHADVDPACAEHYRAAFKSLTEPPVAARGEHGMWMETRPVAPEVIVWVEENTTCLDNIRAASEYQRCWFTFDREPDGTLLFREMSSMRGLARLLERRAGIAGDRHDMGQYAESITLLGGLAGHAADHPVSLWRLTGKSILSLALDRVLEPFTWAESNGGERSEYANSVQGVFLPYGPLHECLQVDLDEFYWTLARQMPWHSRVLTPPARLFGEMQLLCQPFLDHARQPIEERLASLPERERLLRELGSRRDAKPAARIARELAAMLASSQTRVIQLDARLVALQRGNQTAMAILAHHDSHGTYPDSLDELDADFKIDPFTGEPFVYGHAEGGFTLYSVGVDRDDNGGRHHPHWGEGKTTHWGTPPPDGDYVFWPLPEPLPESTPE